MGSVMGQTSLCVKLLLTINKRSKFIVATSRFVILTVLKVLENKVRKSLTHLRVSVKKVSI